MSGGTFSTNSVHTWASEYFPVWISGMVTADAVWTYIYILGIVANICQGGFLPEATMHGLLTLYCAMQRGLVDAKALSCLSTEYASCHKMVGGGGGEAFTCHHRGQQAGIWHSGPKDC